MYGVRDPRLQHVFRGHTTLPDRVYDPPEGCDQRLARVALRMPAVNASGMSSAPSFGRARSHVLGPHASNQARRISYTITKDPRTPQTSQKQRFRRVRTRASESVGRRPLSRDRLEPRSRHHERLERLRALVGYMRRGRGHLSFGYRGLRAALRPIEG